jgi:MFS family permease
MWRRYFDLPRSVHILCLGIFVNRAGGMVMPFLVLYLTESRDFSPAQAARIMGAFGLGSILAGVVGGWLADRVGRKPVMIGALVGAAITLQIVPRLTDELSVFLAVLAFALASEAYRPAGSAMLGDLTGPELRARAYALFYVALNLGFTVGAAAGGALVVATSYDVLFVVEGASAVVFAVFIALALPETRPTVDHTQPSAQAGALAHILRNRPFLAFIVANVLIGLVFNQAFSTLPLHMEHTGIGPDIYGRIMAINGVMIVLGQLPLADRLSRVARGPALVVGTLLLSAGFGLTGAFTSAAALAGCVALWTVGEMVLASLSQPAVNDLAPTAFRARYFGAFSLSFGVAMAVGPPLGGWLLADHGPAVLWSVMAGIGALAAALLWIARRGLAHTPSPTDLAA